MYKSIITLTLLIFTQLSFGQKCKFEINEIDEFTGIRKIRTLATKLNSPFNYGFNVFTALAQADSVSVMYVVLNTISPVIIEEGNKVYFKLSDGSIINTASPKTNVNTKFNFLHIPNTQINISSCALTNIYPIDKATLEKISTLGISKIRVEISDGYLECDVTKRADKVFCKTITCFLNEINNIGK